MRVKFGMEEGPLLRAKFHPRRCNVSPLWGEKPQNRPLSKLNTDALPVIKLPTKMRNCEFHKMKLLQGKYKGCVSII